MKSGFHNVVITGANSGIGAELAKLYAATGVNLGLLARDPQRLEKIADECQARGSHVEYASIDVCDDESLEKWLMEFDEKYPVDLVIAGAGINSVINPNDPVECSNGIREIFDINFFGVIATINPLVARMRARKRGTVSIISSLSAFHGVPLFPAYSASKAAVKSYYESLRGLLKDDNVTVSIACPGFVQTPMTRDYRNRNFKMMTAQKAAQIIKKGIDRGRVEINFPLLDVLGLYLLELLPARIADRIMLKLLGSK